MKAIQKYILPAFITIAAISSAQTVDQNVTVEREYKPVIQDAGKINSVPQVVEPNVEKSVANYTNFNFPLPVGQNIQTLSAAELDFQRRKNPNGAFVRIGIGNYLNNMLDFALPVLKKTDMKLDLNLNHLATFSTEAHSTTNAALRFNNFYKNAEVYAGVGVGYEYFRYYGDQFNRLGKVSDLTNLTTGNTAYFRELNLVRINRTAQTLKLDEIVNGPDNDIFSRIRTYAGINSLPHSSGLRYRAELVYNVFNSRNGLIENDIHTKADLSLPEGQNRAGINIEMQNLIYKPNNANPLINAWDSYTVFSLNPYYSIENDDWNLRIGIKSGFSFVHGRPFNPSPDIYAEWKAVPEWLALYTGIGGSYQVNTLDNMFRENRFLFSDLRVKDTYTPLDATLGIKIKPVYNLLLDAFVNYRSIDNQYFFVNKDYAYSLISSTSLGSPDDSVVYTNKFNVIYSSASLLRIGIRAGYNIRSLVNVELKGSYNNWKVNDIAMAWNKPKFESDLSVDVRVNRNLNVTSNVFYESERFAKLGDMSFRMKPKLDINVGVSYSYLDWFTMFAKINNLINNRYEEFYGYRVQGMNVMVGAAFSF